VWRPAAAPIEGRVIVCLSIAVQKDLEPLTTIPDLRVVNRRDAPCRSVPITKSAAAFQPLKMGGEELLRNNGPHGCRHSDRAQPLWPVNRLESVDIELCDVRRSKSAEFRGYHRDRGRKRAIKPKIGSVLVKGRWAGAVFQRSLIAFRPAQNRELWVCGFHQPAGYCPAQSVPNSYLCQRGSAVFSPPFLPAREEFQRNVADLIPCAWVSRSWSTILLGRQRSHRGPPVKTLWRSGG